MKIGLFLTPWTEGGIAERVRWTDTLSLAQAAESVGFDSVWVSDHLLMRHKKDAPTGGWECWSQIAALAAAVPRVEIGTLVLCTLWRNPALIAKMTSTVDEISGGRLILGVGAGWHEPEFDAFGFPFDSPIGRFEESLKIICPLLRTGHVDFSGKFYQARDCELRPRGPRENGPPIMIGALQHRPRLLRLAATYADMLNAWLAWADNSAQAITELSSAVNDACVKADRKPQSLARSVSIQIDYPGGVPNRNPQSKPLTGDPEQIAASMRAFAVQNIAHLQILLNPNTRQSLERFAPVLDLLDNS